MLLRLNNSTLNIKKRFHLMEALLFFRDFPIFFRETLFAVSLKRLTFALFLKSIGYEEVSNIRALLIVLDEQL